MPAFQAEDLGDLVLGTLRELGPPNYQQIAQNYQSYEWFETMYRKEKVFLDTGYGIQRTLMNRIPNVASHVGLGAPDNVAIFDVADQMQVPWVHAQTSWGLVRHEALMNRGKSLVFNIIKPRREAAMIALVELLETRAWMAPNSTSDKLNPFGVPYWVVKNATEGFNGGAPSGFTTVAGVSLTDSPTFKNYTAGTYALSGGMSKTDAVPKIRKGLARCNFRSPVPGSDYSKNPGRYKLKMNLDTIEAMRNMAEAQNENLGRDIANPTFGPGSLMFQGFEASWVPQLDTDSSNPVYWLDMATWFVYGLMGNWFVETKNTNSISHNMVQYFEELSYNNLCIDRRRNGIIYGV